MGRRQDDERSGGNTATLWGTASCRLAVNALPGQSFSVGMARVMPAVPFAVVGLVNWPESLSVAEPTEVGMSFL
ncbi:MAG: hypothetical protein M3071_21150 [Actinomycetota bacterium]|nr:hypothetical protein [Actinomycetota bacterium]